MDPQLTQVLPKTSTLLISTSVLTAGYLAWKIDFWEAWMKLTKPALIYTRIQGTKTSDVESNNTAEYYYELLQFVNKLKKSEPQGASKDAGKCLEIIYDRPPGDHVDGNPEIDVDSEGLTVDWDYQFFELPPYGTTSFQYKGGKFYLRRDYDHELFVITFKWNRTLMNNFLEEVLELHKKKKKGDLFGFFYLNSTLEWKIMGTGNRKRPLDSVILQEGVKEGLVQDVKEFLDSRAWYLEKGVPYRRGYLLHGPPGTGKTSVICAIAGEIGYDICILSLSSSFLTDDDLTIAMNKRYSKSIVLIEDIDAAFKSPEFIGEGSETTSSSRVTFKGILNALDGVASQESRIVFITTNHIKKLDPALIRPGRIDMKVLIDHATRYQVEKMFHKFYPQLEGEEAQEEDQCREKLAKKLEDVVEKMKKKLSMACVQSLFILHKKDPKAAVENAEKHFNDYTDENNNDFLNCYV